MVTAEEKSGISIVFKEVERLSREPGLFLTDDEIKDYEEIRILREIVLDIGSPKSIHYTST
jgi:hypothetical protein